MTPATDGRTGPASTAGPDWTLSLIIWGWHTDAAHPDPVMREIEGGSPACWDLTDADLASMELHREGRRVDPPGWWRLLPAVTGGLDPYAHPVGG